MVKTITASHNNHMMSTLQQQKA